MKTITETMGKLFGWIGLGFCIYCFGIGLLDTFARAIMPSFWDFKTLFFG